MNMINTPDRPISYSLCELMAACDLMEDTTDRCAI